MIDMLVKGEFSVEYEAQVFPRILGSKDWTPRGERSRGGGLKGPWDLLK